MDRADFFLTLEKIMNLKDEQGFSYKFILLNLINTISENLETLDKNTILLMLLKEAISPGESAFERKTNNLDHWQKDKE